MTRKDGIPCEKKPGSNQRLMSIPASLTGCRRSRDETLMWKEYKLHGHAPSCVVYAVHMCKLNVVGRESVLAAGAAREVRCGRRLVSGLFSRPRLPLGYSRVATVPRGACRLNVSELLPSENYIVYITALKVVNGSYIVNGEFAVSADGAYEAAGARFQYARRAGRDSVFARGPVQEPIDIMILYQHSSPSIKYEYFTDTLPSEAEVDTVGTSSNTIPEIISTDVSKHTHRHHNVNPSYAQLAPPYRRPDVTGTPKDYNDDSEIIHNEIGGRKFFWKVVAFGPCSRSCGGGIQLGKFRCIEKNAGIEGKEVSQVHCGGPPPAMKRRRCGIIPCPPRWRAAAWSTCPDCGPANRTRIIGCVQDNNNGITKVNDQKCPLPKPRSSEPCDIPSCADDDSQFNSDAQTQPESRENTDTFREGPIYTVSVNNTDNDMGPEYNTGAAGKWLYTDWSECVGWCVGSGVKTRSVLCADPAGCEERATPETSKTCKPQVTCGADGQWFTGEWSPCSSPCRGRQTRGVVCIGGGGRRLRDDNCKGPRPDAQRECGDGCTPVWYFSEWNQKFHIKKHFYLRVYATRAKAEGDNNLRAGMISGTKSEFFNQQKGSTFLPDIGNFPSWCENKMCTGGNYDIPMRVVLSPSPLDLEIKLPVGKTYFPPVCTGPCTQSGGVSRRTMWCAHADHGVVPESQCLAPRPTTQRSCIPRQCKGLTVGTGVSSSTTVIPIEAQRKVRDENTSSQDTSPDDNREKGCSDRLRNCALAVQARLCHYVYYTQNCCNSCRGR
ncbi:ADAMTS-like protein 4 [Eumeta japonica]|uniref:ADAMTS-like protein 4 n=1 Tax=Eumeta variegata TaxID=151549 RepID=A0A4C1T5X7_EUMVA|nr:ADAMTS-like protein 4 [Eumeta japonica]